MEKNKSITTTSAVTSTPSSSKTADGSQRDMFAESEPIEEHRESQNITDADVVHAEETAKKNALLNRVSHAFLLIRFLKLLFLSKFYFLTSDDNQFPL